MAVSVFSLCVTLNGASVVHRAEKRGGGRQAERVGTRLQQVTELIPYLRFCGRLPCLFTVTHLDPILSFPAQVGYRFDRLSLIVWQVFV